MADCYLTALRKKAGGNMHKSVLLKEVINYLAPREGDVIIDGTLGAAGHSKELIKKIGNNGFLLGIDQDEKALEIAKRELKGKNTKFVRGNFKDIKEIAKKNGLTKADKILLDLGVSSMQLDESERGFSFSKHAELDMRMDINNDVTAEKVVNEYKEEELIRIFKEYGEEKDAKKIAKRIIEIRDRKPIIWTDQLAEVVRGVKNMRGAKSKGQGAQSSKHRAQSRIDPATKVFQALRIEVNKELFALESALPQLVELLSRGGRFCIISFHSLEDRIVKKFIEEMSKKCTCPPDSPICTCNAKPKLKKVTTKAITAAEEEIINNPRSRSAKMRVAEKL